MRKFLMRVLFMVGNACYDQWNNGNKYWWGYIGDAYILWRGEGLGWYIRRRSIALQRSLVQENWYTTWDLLLLRCVSTGVQHNAQLCCPLYWANACAGGNGRANSSNKLYVNNNIEKSKRTAANIICARTQLSVCTLWRTRLLSASTQTCFRFRN